VYGINHTQNPAALSNSRDHQGFVFFTRPQLNLSDENIRNVRKMIPLMTYNDQSIQMITRCTLDPRAMWGYGDGAFEQGRLACPFVDNMNAFIPSYTNNIKASSGWPDLVVPVYTSANGLYGEQTAMVDGPKEFNEAYTLDCTFRNIRGDVILSVNSFWTLYQSLVFSNDMSPYPDFIAENEIDYTTRIYRITLDMNKQMIQKIAATDAAFPINDPSGVFLDFNNEKPYNEQIAEFTLRFQCVGFTYNDEILIREFNQVVAIFNPYMYDNYRTSTMVLIPREMQHLFKNRGYPRINPETYEFEWWIDAATFGQRVNTFFGAGVGNRLEKY
jgi:hypothetical protein